MRNDKRRPFQAMALMSAILSYLVGPTLVGLFGGKWLDGFLGTSPLFLVIGLLLGLATGILGVFYLVRQFSSGE
ncbi:MULTISPECIES: AtpZ/AtpI family protein [Bacillus]|uniref:AtpZ/AtpI family protein n=1 Tax=Bacillus TaxID=1386 RepID=UPI000BB820A9|nr:MULTISPECIES: AtpZ/AtpI family protein [Bacillus]